MNISQTEYHQLCRKFCIFVILFKVSKYILFKNKHRALIRVYNVGELQNA